MPLPDTLPRKITADFRAEKSMGAEKKFVTLWVSHQDMCIKHEIIFSRKMYMSWCGLFPSSQPVCDGLIIGKLA